jgi:ABC-type transport system involved in multi-copper enzyme maturation permease subunit
MIWHIVRKEILESLLSLRFMLSLIMIISLFAVGGFVFIDKYKQESDEYWKKTNNNLSTLSEQSSQLYKLAFYEQQIWRRPKRLSVCTEGSEKSLPNWFSFDVFTVDLPKVSRQSNFTLPYFSDIDWVFVVSMILSFVALVFTYDSICGERQAGTLRQMLACSIPRHEILLGKYLGAMFALGIPLLAGLLVNLIIVVSSKDMAIDVGEWLKILTIILLSFLYLSIFVLLGVSVSTRSVRSANSMVVLLLMWVGLVILIPSMGRIISDLFCKRPTQSELSQRLSQAREQVNSHVRSGGYGKNAGRRSPNPDECNPPARTRYCNALTDAENQVMGEHHNQMIAQAFMGRNFMSMSPAIIFQRASEAIAGMGINRCLSLYKQIKHYQRALKEYILSKDAEDPDSLHLLLDEKNSTVEWNAISKNAVDFDTVPQFQEQDLGLSESLRLAIWDIGLLVLFNLVFFAAAFVSFLRYDVR